MGKQTTEIRQRAQQVQAAKKKNKVSFREYLKGVKLEMKKVVWPTKHEIGSYTLTVLATCVVCAVAFWAIDTGFLAVLRQLLGINL